MVFPVVIAAVALLAAGFGSHAPDRAHAVPAAPKVARTAPRAAASATIDRLVAVAEERYRQEVSGAAVHAQLRRIARDPMLLHALRAGDRTALQAAALNDQLARHMHVCRVRVIEGSRILADAGGRFVVAASQTSLRTAKGRPAARLEVSIQDMIGYVRYMHRNFPVDVFVRGSVAGHVETSIPAAKTMTLPDRGVATIAGTRYLVRSFTQTAVGPEPVKVWILVRT